MEVTLDCNTSTNMVFSEPNGKVTKIIDPKTLEFMMHAEAAPGAEEFARGAQVIFKEVYWDKWKGEEWNTYLAIFYLNDIAFALKLLDSYLN